MIRKNIWESAGVKFRNVTGALRKAKILKPSEMITSIDDVWKHYINMYSDIQADSLYVRVHNYASAALLYKNMMVVSGICAVKFYLSNQMLEMFVAFMAIIIFAVRWYRFEKKTKCYVINWYVKKYVN